MTDKECFEIMMEYGGEGSLVKVKEMIHLVGVEKAYKTLEATYVKGKGALVTKEFKQFLRQGFNYIAEQMDKNQS